MTKIHLLLAPDNEHNKLFRDTPFTRFRRANSLKDTLVRAKIPHIKNEDRCGSYKASSCKICKYIVPARSFTSV